jgi:hypothetical protein
MANMTVLVGARAYPLTGLEARRLAHVLRACFTDGQTDEAAAGLRLAWALELVLEEDLDEPLEIGWPQADAVIHALPEATAHAHDGLDVLLQAARRLADTTRGG